jgi:hypothetical protein
MANHNNSLSMNRVEIDTTNLKESLINIFKIDLDFDNDYTDTLVDNIIKENEHISDMIECIMTYDDDEDLQFITMSSTCKEYSYELIQVSETEYVFVLAMII